MPWASTTRWRFVPCLPRSVGFLPVSWPPRGRHRGGVQRGPVPVDAIGLGQLFEKHLVQPAPDARLVPVSQPAPARHPAPTPHLGRQVLPGDARLQHEQDPRQRRPVRHPGPSALGLRRLRREQRRDPRPQRIRQQFLRHGTLLHGSYSASLAAYATVLLGVLNIERVDGEKNKPWENRRATKHPVNRTTRPPVVLVSVSDGFAKETLVDTSGQVRVLTFSCYGQHSAPANSHSREVVGGHLVGLRADSCG
jgi:hypothetical protein